MLTHTEMLSADRAAEIDWADLSQLQTTPATSGTALERHFQFAATAVVYSQNRLSQPRQSESVE